MNTFWQTVRFEVRYHLKQPSFYLFYLLICLQGFVYALIAIEEATVGQSLNIATLSYSIFSTVGVLLTTLAALLTGQSLLRDRTYHVDDILYTLPLDEGLYFAGKFIGVLGTCLLLATGVGVGTGAMVLFSHGAVDLDSIAAFVVSFCLLLLPNLLIVVSLAYAFTAFLQQITGAYVALLALVIGQVLFRIGEQTVLANDLLLLLDPFGHTLIREALSQQTSNEQQSGALPIPDLFLINRLLWLGISGGLLVRTAGKLTFQNWSNRTINQAGKVDSDATNPDALPAVSQSFSLSSQWRTVYFLMGHNIRYVVGQPAFLLVALLLFLAVIGYAFGLGNLTETGQRLLPFTSRMTFVRLPLLPFIGLLLAVFTGELVYRDRTTGIWPLTDALPVPGWVMLLAKYGAMLGVAALISATLFLTGLSIQLLNGQTPINWALYGNDLVIDGWLTYAQFIALTCLVQVLIPSRLAGQLAAAVIILLLTAVGNAGWNQTWLTVYGNLPNSWHYSELTGYGNPGTLRMPVAVLWSLCAIGLLLLSVRLYPRGAERTIRQIGSQWKAETLPGFSVWLGAVGMGILVCITYLQFPANKSLLLESTPESQPVAYQQISEVVRVLEHPVTVRYQFVHKQNHARMQAIVEKTLTTGAVWLGTYPMNELIINEVPFYQSTTDANQKQINISERDGWLTDASQPDDAGQFDVSIARTLLRHWVNQKITGNAFISQSLPDYLALRIVQQRRGDAWLTTELARLQRNNRRLENKGNVPGNMPDLLAARGPVSLTCIGEVWGHDKLCRQIGQFVQESKQTDVPPYIESLTNALPDSLIYLTTYLRERQLVDFRIGQLGAYPDRMSVQIRAHKYRVDASGQLNEQLLNDYVPVVLLNAAGKVIYRKLMLVGTDGRTDKPDWLPTHPDAVTIQLDPLGAWPELNKRDNRKQLARL